MANNRVEYTLAFTADTSKAKQQLQSLQGQITGLINNASLNNKSHLGMTKEIQEASAAAAQLKTQLAAATNVNTGKLDLAKFNQSLKSSGMNLDKYRQALVKLGPQGAQTFANLAASITNAEAPIIRVNSHLKKMGDTLLNTARWQLSSSLMNSFVGAVQGAYRYAQDLDKSLTNIRIVTEKSADDMARFAKQANKAAKELGTTTTKYTDAALIYYQQGLTDDQVKQRTDTTIKMANVTGENATEVSSYMTAIWNNFAKGGENLEYFADVITALGAATAASSEEIAGGLEKFAAVGETVGLSYEYATAALTTIIDKTRQSEDVVGTALKTIFARIQGLQQGEETEDGVTLNKYSQALENVGISIMDNNGELKKMDDILDEMGAKWATMSKAQQVALAQTVGGTRQYTQLIALMENWTAMQENLNTAYGASGALEKQNEIYEESWQASANRVKAAWEELYDTILNSDFFIKFNDTLVKIIDLVDILINSLGGVGGVVTAIGVIFMKVYQQQIAKGLTSLGTSMATFFKTNKKDMDDLQKKASESLTKLEVAGAGKVFALQADAQKAYLAVADQLGEEEKERARILLEQHSAMVSNTVELAKQKEILEKQANMQFVGAKSRASERDNDKNDNYSDTSQNQAVQGVYKDLNLNPGNTWEAALNTFKTISTQASSLKVVVEDLFGPRTINAENFNSVKDQLKQNLNELKSEIKESGSSLSKTFGLDAAKTFGELAQALNNPKLTAEELNSILDKLTLQTEEMTTSAGTLGDALESEGILLKNQSSLWSKLGDNIGKILTGKVNLRVTTEGLKTAFQGLNNTLKTSSQYMVQIAQHTASIVSATMAISRLKETWNEETDMSFGERLGSTVTTLGFALPMLSNGITGLSKSVKDWAVALGGTGKAVETVGGSLKVIFTSLGSSIASFLAAAWPFLVAIALITAALGAFYLAYTKDARALEKANKELEKQKNILNETKTAYDNLIKSIENYHEAQNAIEQMTEGTQEWKEAVAEANEEVLKLLDTYPELAKYIETTNGRMTIKQEGLDLIRDQKAKELSASQTATYVATIERNNAQIKNDKTDTQRKISYYSHEAGQEINISNTDLDKVLKAVDEQGVGILANTKALTAATGIDGTLAAAIIQNKDKIIDLNKGIKENTIAVDLLKQQIANKFLNNNLSGSQKVEYENSDYKNQIDKDYAKKTGEGSELYQTELNKQNFKTDEEIQKEYAEARGWTVVKNGWGQGVYKDSNGNEYKVSDTTARAYNASQASMQAGLESGGAFDQSINNINTATSLSSSLGSKNFLANLATGEIDFSLLAPEDYDEIVKLYKEGALKGFVSDEDKNKFETEMAGYDRDLAVKNIEKNFDNKQEDLASSYGLDVAGLEDFQDEIPGVNKLIEENNELGIEATKIALDWSKKGGKVAEKLEEQKEALKDKSDIVNYNKALKEVAEATSDWLGMDVDSDFVEKNMELVTAAANGSTEAMISLRKEATKDYYFNLYPEVDQKALSVIIDSIIDTLEGLKVGEIDLLDPTNTKLLNDLLAMQTLMGWGADEAAKHFKEKFNIDIPITYKEVPFNEVSISTVNGVSTVKDKDGNVLNNVSSGQLAEFETSGVVRIPTFGENNKNLSQATFAGLPTTPPTTTKKTTKGGGSSQKDKKKASDEIERYHEIKETIQSLEKELDRLSKAKDRAFGQEKLDLMDKEIAKTEELKAAQEEYLKQIRENYNKDRAAAASVGAKFDEQGNISNWEEIRKKALDKFNKSGRTDKDEEEYNRIKKILDQYEETHDLLMDEEDKLDDYINQITEAKVAKIQYKVEVKIEIEETELKYLDYLLGNLEDKEWAAAERMKILGTQTQSWLDKYKTYVKELYDYMNTYNISLEDAMGIMTGSYSKEQIDKLGLSEDAVKNLQTLGANFISTAEGIKSVRDAFTQELLDAIAEGVESFDKLGDKIDHTTNTLEHYKNIIDIIGEDALGVTTEQVADLVQTTIDSAITSMNNELNNLKTLQDERDQIYEKWKNATGSEKEQWAKALEDLDTRIREAQANSQASLEEVLNMITEQFKLHVKQAADAFEEAMSGTFGNLDALQEAFDRQKTLDDMYIDDYKQIYELTKLTRDITRSMDEMDGVKGKQALRDLQKEINDLQKEGVKLSEYDLNHLRAKYELELAQIALEEAQNAKTQVRMTRDSEGNWSYTYTADEDSIANAEQAYEDKLYAMQEMNQEYIKNLEGQLIQSMSAMSKAIQDLGPNATQEQIQATMDFYRTQQNQIQQQMQNALGDGKDIWNYMKDYNAATGYGITANENWVDSFDETQFSILTGFETIEDYQTAFGNSVNKMMDGIGAAFDKYNENLKKAGLDTENWGKKLSEILNGKDGKGGVKKDINDLGEESKKLSEKVTKNVGDALTSLATFYDTYGKAIEDAAGKTWGLVDAIKALMDAEKNKKEKDNNKKDEKPKEEPKDNGQNTPELKVGSSVDVKSGTKWYGNSSGGGSAGTAHGGKIVKIQEGATHPYNIDWMGWVKKSDLVGFETGGYTGTWGSAGKVAMLHEKELVLNAQDTENMLKSIEMVRLIVQAIDLNSGSTLGWGGLNSMGVGNGKSEIVQDITINAEFPNATDQDEIKAAFDSLFIRASQYANRK